MKQAEAKKISTIYTNMALLETLVFLGLFLYSISKVARSARYTYNFPESRSIDGHVGPKNISRRGVISVWDGIRKMVRLITVCRSGGDILDDFFASTFEGARTIQETSFDGSKVISTFEPANIQTILATKFEVCRS